MATLGHRVRWDQRLGNLLHCGDHYLRVAEIDGHVAGWIQVQISESLESGYRAEIIGLVVSTQFRRNGIGRALVSDAIEWSASRNVDAVVVRSNVVREDSHQFYPSIGFALIKTQAVYRKVLKK